MDDDRPFVIHSATKITLGPVAKEWAKEFGPSEVEMAKHLLNQHSPQQCGLVQKQGED